MLAGAECRRIAKVAHEAGTPTEVYGTESETMFKAVLYHYLRTELHKTYGLDVGETLNRLGLEPTKVCNLVDMVYCDEGLAWNARGDYKNYFVEVKPVARKRQQNALYRRSIERLKADVENLYEAGNKFGDFSELIEVAAFIDYTAAGYFDRTALERIVRPHIPKAIRLIVC